MRLLKESSDNDSRLFNSKTRQDERRKSEKEREQNESLERELRPWNAPAPIDEMEFQLKSQESDKHKKGKREMKKRMQKVQEGKGDSRKHLHSEQSVPCQKMI